MVEVGRMAEKFCVKRREYIHCALLRTSEDVLSSCVICDAIHFISIHM